MIDTVENSVLGKAEELPSADAAEAERIKNKEAIVRGLLDGRVVWRGSFWRDFWFYLKQNHVLLSIWYAHERHPFSEKERLYCWFTSALASFGFALLLADPDTGEQQEGNFAASILISIYLCVHGFIKGQAATCSCFQAGSRFEFCKAYAECSGRFIMGCQGCIAVFWLIVGFAVAFTDGTPFKATFWIWLEAQAFSWALALGQCFLCFRCAWKRQSSRKDDSNGYPHGPEYPNDELLMWGGDPRVCGWCCAPAELPKQSMALDRE